MSEHNWIDERGLPVKIVPFVSRLYLDEESRRLSELLTTWAAPTERIHLSLDNFSAIGAFGKAKIEEVVEVIIKLCSFTHRVVGIAKEELYKFFEHNHGFTLGGQWFIQGLVDAGYLREKWIRGVLVVFPTEKMLRQLKRSPKESYAAR